MEAVESLGHNELSVWHPKTNTISDRINGKYTGRRTKLTQDE